MLLPEEIEERRQLLSSLLRDGGCDPIDVSLLIGVRVTKDASAFPSLDEAHRRQAIVGTVGEVDDQLMAHERVGVNHLQLTVTVDESLAAGDRPSDSVEFFLREIWAAFLDRNPAQGCFN